MTSEPILTLSEWISVLKLSTMWSFLKIRRLAIERVTSVASTLPAVDRILLGRQHFIAPWVESGLEEIVTRKEKLTLPEASCLGLETTLRMGHLRERDHLSSPYYMSVGGATAVEKEFAVELTELGEASRAIDPEYIPGPIPKPGPVNHSGFGASAFASRRY